MGLSLDYDTARSAGEMLLSGAPGFVCSGTNLPRRNGNTVFRQQLFSLVFVKVHADFESKGLWLIP